MECNTDSDFQRAVQLKNRGESNLVTVAVPAQAYYNLDQLQEIQRTVLGKLGHLACVSGFDIRFDMIRQFEVTDKMEVLTAGGFRG